MRGGRASYALWLALALIPRAAAANPDSPPLRLHLESVSERVVVASWDAGTLRAARDAGRPLVVRDFPLPTGRAVDLELEPYSVTSARTRFVVGRKDGADRPLDFDPGELLLFRGRVAGHASSRVLLALGSSVAAGHVDLDGRRFRISSRGEDGSRLAAGRLSIFEATAASGMPPGVPLCGVADAAPPAIPGGAPAVAKGAQQLELAVETDYEFFQLFGDLDLAAAYVIALYAEVGQIYLRDVNTWVDLVFVRLWDDPDDLFNVVEPSPLGDFRSYWNAIMGDVSRDAAQLLSGRRDYPFGGQAFVSSLCGSNAYSVVGYAAGSFPEPSQPSPYTYDIMVTAHELGHNSGTGHTHDYGIDSCADPDTTPQRGTIMSYCGQTWSGGNANHDNYFHTAIEPHMESHIFGSSCIADDCNLNGIADATDIQLATSADADGDGTPDECEDCNANFVLDDSDIALGTSLDLDGNGVPDECESDCDGNAVPDAKQIADGLSTDAYGNGVPDECEVDCNANGTSDYTEIQLDMALDVDRNAILDACQDCDADGTPDLAELGGAHAPWIGSGLANSQLKRFHPGSGVLTVTTQAGSGESQDLIATPDGYLLVTSAADDTVKRFDGAGTALGNFVGPASGGLSHPSGLLLTAAGVLLVASRDTDEVLSYDGVSGAPLGALVTSGTSPLDAPFGMTLGPDGKLYVTSLPGAVLRYDVQSGAFLGTFVPAAANGGLDQPRGLVFKPDGNLIVASYGTDEVLEYDGASGAPLGKWAQAGTATVLTQSSPWGMRVGPNGNVFVIRTGEAFDSSPLDDSWHDHELHLTQAQIYEYDVRNGNFVRAYVTGNDHELLFPTGFDFAPGWDVDCNFNLIPDACDIASGSSQDADQNETPDECEIDCNGNGKLDRLDLIPFGASRDCNANLTPDECDLASGTSGDCTSDGVPDECQPDCNGNASADVCDIAAGTSRDCNGNATPDECDAIVDLESNPGWTVGAAGDTASGGVWVRVNPVGTDAQPEYDVTPGAGTTCYVTGQGSVGGPIGAADVDGGATTLTTTAINLTGEADPHLGYWRWFSNDEGTNPGQDVFRVRISNNGGASWVDVETVGPGGPQASGGWFFHSFRVADFVAATANVRLRFVATDALGPSTVEAAIDDLVVQPFCCETPASCDDGLGCTLDLCPLSGHCSNVSAPGTCLIAGACYTAGELNPANDCEACSPAAPVSWSPAPPAEVGGVLLGHAPTVLSWASQAAAAYDVAGGELAALHADLGVDSAVCLEPAFAATTWPDPRPDPPPATGYYYLVRSRKSCGAGIYGFASSGAPRLPDAACP